jgi:Xaa-Pro dipeptidase
MTVPKAPAFSVGEYRRRVAAVQRGLAERDLDGLVLFSAGHINYLTGMDSENLFDIQACILTRDGDPVLVVFDFERGRFDNSAWLAEPVAYGPFDDPISAVVDQLRRLRLDRARLGVEQRQPGLPPLQFLRLQAALPGAKVEDAFGPVERARLVKSADEIALMRQAAAFTDGGVRAGYAAIASGVRDATVGAAMVDAMYRAGSDTVCWGPVVAAGYRAGLAHSSFNGHVIARGETVFLELTGQHRRYVAPVMRTAVVGPPTAEHRRLAQASADAVAAILETARAGTPARIVAEAGLRCIRPVERDVVFHYYFGYPVGIGYPPSWIETLGFFIRTDNPAPLEAGMVFHLPMSLRVAGRLGICLSQTMLVTPEGGVSLTGTRPELVEVPA